MKLDLLQYYQTLRENNINIIYSGPIWQEGMEGIAETVKRRIAFDELPLPLSQAIFSVFVEQVTNMLMYSEDKEICETPLHKTREAPTGVFVFGRQGDAYFMQSGNAMKEASVSALKSRIDYLNTLDKAELRKYYKEQLKSANANPESKGAGLGFIEIARRASSKIEYSFTPLPGGRSFFTIYVTIGQGGSGNVVQAGKGEN